MFEAGVKVLLLILLLSGLHALIRIFGLIGGGVSIHNKHVVNTVCPLRLNVFDEEIPLQLLLFLRRGPFEFALTSTHVVTCVFFEVVTHVSGVEGLAHKIDNSITDIVVTRRD